MAKYHINNNMGSVNLSLLEDGVYIFSLNNEGETLKKKIVLRK